MRPCWRLKENMAPFALLLLPVREIHRCFFFFWHLFLWCCVTPRIELNKSWVKSSKTVSPNEPFLSVSWLFGVFTTVKGNCLIHWLFYPSLRNWHKLRGRSLASQSPFTLFLADPFWLGPSDSAWSTVTLALFPDYHLFFLAGWLLPQINFLDSGPCTIPPWEETLDYTTVFGSSGTVCYINLRSAERQTWT